ncbi:MAG: hypothetical protein M0Z30_06830 [Actinomycetota bacterium]|nr:hypothetical protein [Actinomycetota bacterium]
MRQELSPQGFELVDVCLEMAGPEVARPFVEAAASSHPSLIDRSHLMDSLFGVTNVPQMVWIDEDSMIVRPAHRASPMPIGDGALRMVEMIGGMEERERYVEELRDWVRHGPDSRHAFAPDQVVEQSRPRPPGVSEAAAHFAIAEHYWQEQGLSPPVIDHFNHAHRLQPDNVTFKRQAWSALAVERSGDGGQDEWTRFRQAPVDGEDWPFVSDFNQDIEIIMGRR